MKTWKKKQKTLNLIFVKLAKFTSFLGEKQWQNSEMYVEEFL